MNGQNLIGIFVHGEKNVTKIKPAPSGHNDATLDRFARAVAKKDPNKSYYVYPVSGFLQKRSSDEPLYVWHVGEGFEHHQGWWIRWDE